MLLRLLSRSDATPMSGVVWLCLLEKLHVQNVKFEDVWVDFNVF